MDFGISSEGTVIWFKFMNEKFNSYYQKLFAYLKLMLYEKAVLVFKSLAIRNASLFVKAAFRLQ